MSDAIALRLFSPVQAHKEIAGRVWPLIKSMLTSGHRLVLEVKPETRSLKENAMLHAMLTRISKQLQWAGAYRDVETWKRLLTAAWLRARGEHVEVLPAVDGHGVDVVFRRTSQLTRAECAELITFIQCFAAEHGVSLEYIDPETGEVCGA